MKSLTKAMGNIRRKKEEARRNQEAALNRNEDENLAIGVTRVRDGSRMSRPGRSDKVNLSHFKLKTVLGRGGYGKARIVRSKGIMLSQNRSSWPKGFLTRGCVRSRQSARRMF